MTVDLSQYVNQTVDVQLRTGHKIKDVCIEKLISSEEYDNCYQYVIRPQDWIYTKNGLFNELYESTYDIVEVTPSVKTQMKPKQIYLIKLTCIQPIYAENVEEATTITSAKKQDIVNGRICDITVIDRIGNRDKLMQDYHYLQGTHPYDYNGKMEDNCYDLLTDPKVRIVNDQLTELQKNQILLDHFTLQELQSFSQNKIK